MKHTGASPGLGTQAGAEPTQNVCHFSSSVCLAPGCLCSLLSTVQLCAMEKCSYPGQEWICFVQAMGLGSRSH